MQRRITKIEGFMRLMLYDQSDGISKYEVLIPQNEMIIVAICGNTTGRIYTFALKAIIPDVFD